MGVSAVSISVVVPVYRGEETLPGLIDELAALTAPGTTAGGRSFRVSEVLLVWDNGPGRGDSVIRDLAQRFSWV